jgi:trigger factor
MTVSICRGTFINSYRSISRRAFFIMSATVEKLDHNMAKITVEVAAEDFEKAIQQAYLRQRSRITIPGFRKGKAPRKLIEKMYGAGVFYEDAANTVIPSAYSDGVKETGENVVSSPKIEVTQIEAGKPFIFTAEVALKPAVKLGQYKGIEVEKENTEVTDEEVEKKVDEERNKNARTVDVTDRPVQNGDIIKLDFDGSVDGVPFEGGKADNYTLTIGSGSFIPGFEEQLIGMNIGEEKDVNVKFPEDYHAEDLKGKDAVFKCKVNAIQVKEVDDADDEFAQDKGFDNMDAYREDIRKNLKQQKEDAAKRTMENKVVEQIVKNAQMDIPDAMVMDQVKKMQDDFSRRVSSQGISMEQYLQFTGMTLAQLSEQMKPEALKRIQNSLVLEAVRDAENIEITDEKVDGEIARIAEQYKMDKDKLKSSMGPAEIDEMKDELGIQAAVDLVRDAAVEVEKAAEEETFDDGAAGTEESAE